MKHHAIVPQERLRLAEIISVLQQRLRILADNPQVALVSVSPMLTGKSANMNLICTVKKEFAGAQTLPRRQPPGREGSSAL